METAESSRAHIGHLRPAPCGWPAQVSAFHILARRDTANTTNPIDAVYGPATRHATPNTSPEVADMQTDQEGAQALTQARAQTLPLPGGVVPSASIQLRASCSRLARVAIARLANTMARTYAHRSSPTRSRCPCVLERCTEVRLPEHDGAHFSCEWVCLGTVKWRCRRCSPLGASGSAG